MTIMVVVFAVLVVVMAAVLLVFFPVSDGPQDRGFMSNLGPWRDGMIPFTLILDEDLVDSRIGPRFQEAIIEACTFWERNVPGLFVEYGSIGGGAMIPVMPSSKLTTWDKETSCCNFGYTRMTLKDDKVWSASVYVDMSQINAITSTQLVRALAHEMGHVAGLAHDENRLSVMHPQAINEAPVLTDRDRELLKKVYI